MNIVEYTYNGLLLAEEIGITCNRNEWLKRNLGRRSREYFGE